MTATRIGVAVVEHEGRFLVGTRDDDGPLPGFAEFPGGKCNESESPEACAVRECHEETGLVVRAEELLHRVTHQYDHGELEIHFWRCDVVNRDPASPAAPFCWVARSELQTLAFPPANDTVIALICDG